MFEERETRNESRHPRDVAAAFLISFLASRFSLFPAPALAADSLSQWFDSLDKVETQQKILYQIFSSDVGPASAAVAAKNGGFFFPKGGSWVQLGNNVVYSTGSAAAPMPYLVVSATMFHKIDQPPINATSYLFQDTESRPVAISGGYAGYEQVEEILLPGLGRAFLLLTASSSELDPRRRQWNAFLLQPELDGYKIRPKTVWSSPLAAHSFQFGFDPLGTKVEKIVMRTQKNGDVQYAAYQWTGSRFEPDTFASERQMKSLPASVWKFGTP
jgi:hypothetical protein